MKLTLIAAVAADGAIGRGGNLAFHIGADLRHFKELTMGCPVVMGRKTFDSLPSGALPGRRNIVVTRNPAWTAPGVETASTIDDALALTADAPQVFVIGGATVYGATIDRADSLEITQIKACCPDADTFFPDIDPARWAETASTPDTVDPRTGLTYRFVTFTRR